jgi:hypothetical protein
MPTRDELRSFVVKRLSRNGSSDVDEDAVDAEVVHLLGHWHRLREPKRRPPSWPEGVSESDPISSWGFLGVHSGLESGRLDLWRRVLDAATSDDDSAELLRESFPLLDYRDVHDWLLAQAPAEFTLPTHDGDFPGTEKFERWVEETPWELRGPT